MTPYVRDDSEKKIAAATRRAGRRDASITQQESRAPAGPAAEQIARSHPLTLATVETSHTEPFDRSEFYDDER